MSDKCVKIYGKGDYYQELAKRRFNLPAYYGTAMQVDTIVKKKANVKSKR